MNDFGVLAVEMEDGRQDRIGDVAILTACEPSYEHFGGEGGEARANIARWFEAKGPFRNFPR